MMESKFLNKQVLVLAYYSPPFNCMGSVRLYKMLKILSLNGFHITVVTSAPKYLKPNLNFELNNVIYLKYNDFLSDLLRGEKKNSKPKNLTVFNRIKIKTLNIFSDNLIFPDRYIFWLLLVLFKFNPKVKPSYVYSTALPFSNWLLGHFLSKKFKSPHVVELRDHWSKSPYNSKFYLRRYIDEKLEKYIVKKSYAQIGVSDGIANYLHKLGGNGHAIYTGYDIDFDNSIELQVPDKKIKIVYTGLIYEGKRDPSNLINFILEDADLLKLVEFHFYGNGFESLIDKYVDFSKNIFFHGEITHQESLKVQNSADILLLLTWNNPYEDNIISGKLFEYISTGKPIIHIGNNKSELSNIILKYNLGLNFTNDPIVSDTLKKYILESKNITRLEPNKDLSSKQQFEKLLKIFKY